MRQVSYTFKIKAPQQEVFNFLTDIRKLAECIPQLEELTVINQTESQWKLRLSAGFVSQVVLLRTKLEEVKPYSTASFKGEGTNIRVAGRFELKPINSNETEVYFTTSIDVSGPLGWLIDIVMGPTADRLAQEIITNLKNKLER